ncbi:MAG: ABC transporter permease [Dehalococcoidia bacterium]|nr:ABC transporter permease [Dehalococcoidia bacterium]
MTSPTETVRPAVEPRIDATLESALASGTRPKQPGPLGASLVFGWRALLKIKHVPEQLFDVTMFPIMFVLMFTYLFGGALAGSPGEYLQFLLPGIVVQTVVMITMYTGMTVNKDIEKGVFDRFRSLPVWRPSFMVGALLGDTARYSMASAIIVGLGLLLGFRPEGGAPGVILAVALVLVFAFGVSWIWTTLGMIMRSEQAVMMATMSVLFPVTFVSNIFVDPATMPGWLQAFVDRNPISILTDASRGLMAGSADWSSIGIVLAISAGMTAVFAPITMHLYRTKH